MKNIRIHWDLSQREMGKILGEKVTQSSVGTYEKKNVSPKLDALVRLSRATGISISDLQNKDIDVRQLGHKPFTDERIDEVHLSPSVEEPVAPYIANNLDLWDYRTMVSKVRELESNIIELKSTISDLESKCEDK